MLNDIASVELERVGFDGAFGQHNGRIERTQSASRAVRDEVDVRKRFGVARQVRRRSCPVSLVNLFLRCWEVFGDVRHLLSGTWQFGVFLAGGDAVADEKQGAGALLLAGAVAGSLRDE